MGTDLRSLGTLRIDDICRTERYYTATLLPHLLFHEEFNGLHEFLKWLHTRGIEALDAQTDTSCFLWKNEKPVRVELITEMDIVRDIKFYSQRFPGLRNIGTGSAKMLRPDVVILVNRLALVIEGKFFHDSYSVNDARMQLAAQRQVIKDIILNFPGYDLERYAQIFLAEQTLTTAEDLGCQGVITWTDIGKLSSKLLGTEHYVTQRFTRAVTLYHALRGVHTSQGSSGIKNYRSKFSFTGILRKCEDEGDQILVGFQGGLSKLWVSDVEHLRKRNYKWDLSSDPIPPKRSENWISGSAFLNTLKQKMGEDYEEGPRTETIIEARGRTIGSNYRGKLSFSGMINKCNKHGAKVLVGFNGGYSGLRDAKKSYLTNREYKWDWTEAPILPKKMSNWIAGDRFLGVVFEKVPSARSID